MKLSLAFLAGSLFSCAAVVLAGGRHHGLDRYEVIGRYRRLYGLALPESRAGVESGAYDIRSVA